MKPLPQEAEVLINPKAPTFPKLMTHKECVEAAASYLSKRCGDYPLSTCTLTMYKELL